MRDSLRAGLLSIAALLMGFSAVMNAMVAIPHLRGDLAEIHVRWTLVAAVSLGLYFGAFSMFAFTLIVIAMAVKASQGASLSAAVLWATAVTYFAFGVGAFFVWSHSPHTLGYVAIGILIGASAALRKPR